MKRLMLIAAVLVLVLSPIDAAADFTTCYPLAASYNTGSTDGSSKTRTSEIAGYDSEDGWAMFDTSAIPDTDSIVYVEFHFYVNSTDWPWWSRHTADQRPAHRLGRGDSMPTSMPKPCQRLLPPPGRGHYVYHRVEDTGTGRHGQPTDMAADLGDDWFALGVASTDDNTTFYIIVDGWAETNPPYLVVEHIADSCSNHLIDLGSMGCGDVLSHTGDTTGATNFCGQPSGDNFLEFEVLEDGLYTLDMCFYEGTLFDTVLWLYDDECCGNVIAVNDDSDYGCGLKSRIDIVLSPGTYYAQVEGYDVDEGLYRLDITCDQPVDLGPVPCFEEIVYNQDTSGAINYCGHPSGDAHFKFTVDYTANYTVSLCNHLHVLQLVPPAL